MNHFSITIRPRGDIYNVDLDESWNVLSADRFLPMGGSPLHYPVPDEIPREHLIQMETRARIEKKKSEEQV